MKLSILELSTGYLRNCHNIWIQIQALTVAIIKHKFSIKMHIFRHDLEMSGIFKDIFNKNAMVFLHIESHLIRFQAIHFILYFRCFGRRVLTEFNKCAQFFWFVSFSQIHSNIGSAIRPSLLAIVSNLIFV